MKKFSCKKDTQQKDDEIPLYYTRVTEPLSMYSKLDKVNSEVLEKAQERGTEVHDACERYARNSVINNVSLEVKGYVDSFIKWFDNYVESGEMIEHRMIHKKLLLTGKFDLLCKLKYSDKIVLVDYKTCEQVSKTWGLQTAAYAFLLHEIEGIKVDRRIAIRLEKNGNFPKLSEFLNYDRDISRYLHCLDLYRFFN